jgi:hypothetical protein
MLKTVPSLASPGLVLGAPTSCTEIPASRRLLKETVELLGPATGGGWDAGS